MGTLRRVKHRANVLRMRIKEIGGLRSYWSWTRRKGQRYSWDKSQQQVSVLGVEMPRSTSFRVDHLFHPRRNENDSVQELEPCPKVLWIAWTGPNKMTEVRENALSILRKCNSGLEIRFVTPETLSQWEIAESPLLPEYQRLGYTHRSDYLRAYLLHHYGGVWADVKPLAHDLSFLVDALNSDPTLMVAAPAERKPWNVSPMCGPFGEEQRKWFDRLPWQSVMALRPFTPFSAEWLNEVERRVRYFSDLLDLTDGEPRNEQDPEYPIPWDQLMGAVFYPLAMKYSEFIWLAPAFCCRERPYK